jgi:hypothetical protein
MILCAILLAGLLVGSFFWVRYEKEQTFCRTLRTLERIRQTHGEAGVAAVLAASLETGESCGLASKKERGELHD